MGDIVTAETQIRRQIAQYLDAKLTFEQFEDQFLALTWESPDEPSRRLAAAIEHRITEYTDGVLSDGDFAQMLLPFVTSYTVIAGAGPDTASDPAASTNNSVHVLSPLAAA